MTFSEFLQLMHSYIGCDVTKQDYVLYITNLIIREPANDAEEKGATAIEINKQLNHASLETTKRYIRRKSDGVNNVLRLRAEHK